MKLPTVKNFLFCCKLETGGLVIGWLATIGSILACILMAFLGIASIIGLANFDEFIQNETNTNPQDRDVIKAGLIIVMVVSLIMLAYFIVVCVAAIRLIKGTKSRNHELCKMYMILMAVGVILSFIQIFTSGVNGIAGAIVGAIVSAYFFICIYSMYQMFKEEKLQKLQAQPYTAQQPQYYA